MKFSRKMLLTKFFLHFFTYLIEVIFFQCNTDLLPRIIFSVLSFDTPLQTAVFVARVSAPIGFSVKCVAAAPSRCRSDTDFCDMLSGRQRQGGKCRIVCTLPLTTVVSMPLRQFPSRCRSDKNRSSVQGLI